MSNGTTSTSNQVEPDEAAILRHLELLAAPAVSSSIADGLVEVAYGTTEPNKAHLFVLSELDQAVTFAARVNRAGNQVYVGAALRRPGSLISKRTTKAEFYGSALAWLDDAKSWKTAKEQSVDCPPDVVICTGKVPSWRGQLLWRFFHPITDPERLEALTRGIAHRLGGDEVWNCDRLIRLAGTVNWPIKPGRSVPELVTLRWSNGAASATDFDLAWRGDVR
jgi:RepB DNA-primase from phage plasmid